MPKTKLRSVATKYDYSEYCEVSRGSQRFSIKWEEIEPSIRKVEENIKLLKYNLAINKKVCSNKLRTILDDECSLLGDLKFRQREARRMKK